MRDAFTELLDQARQEGQRIGEEQGEKRAEKRAAALLHREAIGLYESRFGVSPEWVQRAITSTQDVARLGRWLSLIAALAKDEVERELALADGPM
jgi:hypothetical protein